MLNKLKTMIAIIIFLPLQSFTQELWTEIDIPVRDEKMLKADLYSTDTNTAKPVILIHTPYNKEYYRNIRLLPKETIVNALFDTINYNYVIMDWRGFYANKNAAEINYDRGLDGYDAIEWIAEQNWSNGKIGTSGSSALGHIQFITARHNPPHLICSAPFVKDFKTKYSVYYYGGVLRHEHVEMIERLGFTTIKLITAHPVEDNFWKYAEFITDISSEIEVPMLLVSGWFDHYPSDVVRAFHDLQSNSHESVKDNHKLILGPWLHSSLGKSEQGEIEYPNAVNIPQQATKQFFDYYLRAVDNDWLTNPTIRYYQMGKEQWHTTNNWYKLSSNSDTLYLYDNGGLRPEYPPATMPPLPPPDTIIYSPRDPSPSIGGSRFNPFDLQTPLGPMDISNTVEARNDILIYTTKTLENDITVIGKIEVELFISSNRTDTDFAVRLCDVYPDGRSIIITQGIKRARFRNSLSNEELLTPGETYPITIELSELAMTFIKGHKLRIDITSSNFPMFDINPNTGGELYQSGDTLTAMNLIYHHFDYPSRVIIPSSMPTNVVELKNKYDNKFKIYPNPATNSSEININFSMPHHSYIEVELINSSGLILEELYSDYVNAGMHSLQFTPDGELSAGTYWIRMMIDNTETIVKPIVILK